jgi:methionyl aminopeptidase
MSIESPEELAGMRDAGAVVRRMLEVMKQAVRPGVTTAELDEEGARVMRQHGARSSQWMAGPCGRRIAQPPLTTSTR